MTTPLIGITEVKGALHNARVVMNAYLRSRINATADGEIRIAVNKKAPQLKYEAEDGSLKRISTVTLKGFNDNYYAIYNQQDEPTLLPDLSANELYLLCELVESFWRHIKTENKTDVENVECEIVK